MKNSNSPELNNRLSGHFQLLNTREGENGSERAELPRERSSPPTPQNEETPQPNVVVVENAAAGAQRECTNRSSLTQERNSGNPQRGTVSYWANRRSHLSQNITQTMRESEQPPQPSPPPPQQSRPGQEKLAPSSPRNIPKGLRVLVVDDDPLTRTLMTRMLTRLECIVDTAENGRVALDKILGKGSISQRNVNIGGVDEHVLGSSSGANGSGSGAGNASAPGSAPAIFQPTSLTCSSQVRASIQRITS